MLVGACTALLASACGGSDSGDPGTGGGGGGVSATAGNGGSGALGTAGIGAAGVSGGNTSTGTAGSAGTSSAAGSGGTQTAMCTTTEVKTGTCKDAAEGVYAIKVDFDVWWRDEVTTPYLIEPGRGIISVIFRGEISDVCDDGSDGVGKLHPCGSQVPPFLVGANCTAVQILFPEDLWDKPTIPDYSTKGSTTGFNPGDILTIAQTSGLLGIELASPDAPFPTYMQTNTFTCPSGTLDKCFPDQDMDGHPGVTVHFAKTGTFTKTTTPKVSPYDCNAFPGGDTWTMSEPPLSVIAVLPTPDARISDAYVGMKLSAGGAGKIQADCMSGVGDAVAGDTIPARVFDCKKGDGNPCAPADATFIDTNTPLYHVLKKGEKPPAEWKHPNDTAKDALLDRSESVGPRSAVVRLGDLGTTKTCADARAVTFPAFQ